MGDTVMIRVPTELRDTLLRRARSQHQTIAQTIARAIQDADGTPPVLDSWEAIRALQLRMADGTATPADRYAFEHSMDDYELTDEDREWLDADLTGPIDGWNEGAR